MAMNYPKDLSSIVMRYGWGQVYRNNSSMNVIITGQPGTGKSWVAQQLLYAWVRDQGYDKIYNPLTHCFFEPWQFKEGVAREEKRGMGINLEEAGVMAMARKWQSKENIDMSVIFQIMREKNRFTVITVPESSMIDLHMRITAHVIIKVKGHDRWHSWGDVCLLDPASKIGDTRIFEKRLRFTSRAGNSYKVIGWWAPAPPKYIQKMYDERATAWKHQKLELIKAEAMATQNAEALEKRESQEFEDLLSRLKVMVETGEVAVGKDHKVSRAVAQYKLGVPKSVASKACLVLENDIKTGSVQPGVARGD